ncbi:hypothetical protein ACYULU_04785 [Breznakiellaceae bacterium SP9]
MDNKSTENLFDILSDRFKDIWKLLSETTVFLSRTKEFPAYESQLRQWRSQLQHSSKDLDLINRIRAEIRELRKSLRLAGYDLSLGKQNLIIDGFRNDACLGEGFRRVVLFFTNNGISYLAGEDNHVTLSSLLEAHIDKQIRSGQSIRVFEKHYLWYRRSGADLILCGADTETKEDFERIKARGAVSSLAILSSLKKLT